MSLQTLLWVASSLAAAMLAAATVVWQRRLRTDAPGPPQLPLVGIAHLVSNPAAAMKTFKRCYKTYGTTFSCYLGTKLMVVVTRPEDLEKVLGDPSILDRDHYMSKMLSYFIGDGILCSTGDKWRTRRKLISPTFGVKNLEGFLAMFNEAGSMIVAALEKTRGLEMDVFEHVAAAGLTAMSESMMGGFPTDIEFSKEEVMTAISRFMQLLEERTVRPWLQVLEPLLCWTKLVRDCRKVVSVVNSYTESVIARKVRELHQEGVDAPARKQVCDGEEDVRFKPKRSRPFLELLMKEEGGMQLSAEDLKEEVCTLFVTGYDSSANSTTFTMAMLSLHPEWQQAVHQELDEVFGCGGEDYHRPVTIADLAKLKVMERVMKETQRLFTVAPLLPRQIPTDMVLGDGNYKVPAGTCALIISFFTHRDPRHYPDPERFDPDRFLPENCARRHPYSYIPFGAGARNCVGNRYAMMQMKTVLATVLRRFRVLPVSTREELEDLQLTVVTRPVKEIRLRFESRWS